MLETHPHGAAAVTPDAAAWADRPVGGRYAGPERRRSAAVPHDAFGAVLDELDHGVVLLCPEGEVLYMNRAAAVELEADHPLRRVGRRLQARRPSDAVTLQEALFNASRRRWRKLVFLGGDREDVGVSVVPIPIRAPGGDLHGSDEAVPALLVLGRRHVCEPLSVQAFAAGYQLTNAETRVLGALCSGLPPARIAQQVGVAISTVRTHIGTIRVKTGATGIRALVEAVARLPPLMSALRQSLTALAATDQRPTDRRDRLQ